MNKAIFVMVCVALSGCITTERADRIISTSSSTSEYDKRIIVQYIRDTYKDPYSIKDAQISDTMINLDGVKWICIYLNAKNSFGAYVGRKLAGINIKGSRITRYWNSDTDCELMAGRGLRFNHFPELENL